jgi:carboxylesterase type B
VFDVYWPPKAKNLPVIVWIHGGGWQMGDQSSVRIEGWGVRGQRVCLCLHERSL